MSGGDFVANYQIRVTPDEDNLIKTVRSFKVNPKILILQLVDETTLKLRKEVAESSEEVEKCRRCGSTSFTNKHYPSDGRIAMICNGCQKLHRSIREKIS